MLLVCSTTRGPLLSAAEVEIRDQPELANKPVAVGGLGMISVLAGAHAVTGGSLRVVFLLCFGES